MKIPAHEELLLARCFKREEAAVSILASLYGQRVYGFIKTLLGQESETANNVLIRVFAEAIEEVIPFSMREPFLVTVMRKLIRELSVTIKKTPALHQWKDLDVQRQNVFQALHELTLSEMILLLLRDQMDFDHDEIAAVLHQTTAQVKTELQAVRLHFRELVDILLSRGKEPHAL